MTISPIIITSILALMIGVIAVGLTLCIDRRLYGTWLWTAMAEETRVNGTKWWLDETDTNRLHAQANKAWRRLESLLRKRKGK